MNVITITATEELITRLRLLFYSKSKKTNVYPTDVAGINILSLVTDLSVDDVIKETGQAFPGVSGISIE